MILDGCVKRSFAHGCDGDIYMGENCRNTEDGAAYCTCIAVGVV